MVCLPGRETKHVRGCARRPARRRPPAQHLKSDPTSNLVRFPSTTITPTLLSPAQHTSLPPLTRPWPTTTTPTRPTPAARPRRSVRASRRARASALLRTLGSVLLRARPSRPSAYTTRRPDLPSPPATNAVPALAGPRGLTPRRRCLPREPSSASGLTISSLLLPTVAPARSALPAAALRPAPAGLRRASPPAGLRPAAARPVRPAAAPAGRLPEPAAAGLRRAAAAASAGRVRRKLPGAASPPAAALRRAPTAAQRLRTTAPSAAAVPPAAAAADGDPGRTALVPRHRRLAPRRHEHGPAAAAAADVQRPV